MWKRIGVVIIALISTFSVAYAVNDEMHAATRTTYNAGGNVTGRVNQAPVGISGSNIGMQKGDKLSTDLGTGWILIDYQTYDTYNCTSNKSAVTMTCPTGNPTINAWMSMTTSAIDEINFGLSVSDFSIRWSGTNTLIGDYSSSNLSKSLLKFNNELNNSNSDKSLITYRNWTRIYETFKNKDNGVGNQLMASLALNATSEPIENGKSAFSPAYLVKYNNTQNLGGALNDMAYTSRYGSFETDYWTTYINSTANTKYSAMEILASGAGNWTQNSTITSTIKKGVRPSAYINTNDIVFAVSQGQTNEIGKITEPKLDSSYTNIYNETKIHNNMKARVYDGNYQATLNGIKNKDNKSITKISKNSTITLDVTANNYNNSTVSVLLFDATTGQFEYYMPLGEAGQSSYTFDLSGIDNGKYEIAIVNEAYDDLSQATTYSSYISSPLKLEILTSLNTLSFMPSHGKSSSDYYFTGSTGNVKVSEKVASISSKDGVGGTIAENGIIYKLHPSTISGHGNDYQLFSIPTASGSDQPMLDSTTQKPFLSAVPINGASSLPPGMYSFRIQAYDANGDPLGAQLNDGTPVSGISPDQGLITSDETIVVYPNDSQLDFIQKKNSNIMYTKAELNALPTGSLVATATFANDANISALLADGYNIKSVKLLDKGKTTELKELEAISTGNINEYQIKKINGANFTSDISFDILVTFERNGAETAIVRKDNQKFEVPAGLSFVDTNTSTFLNPNKYTYTYDPGNTNEFILKATDNANPAIPNTNVKYCILDSSKVCTSNSSVISFVNGANQGMQKVEVKAPGTTDKIVNVRATTEDSSGNIIMLSDLEITIHPAQQKLTWVGTNIQSTGNNIDVHPTKHNTWTLDLKYDKDPAANNSHTSAEIIGGGNVSDTVITLKDDVISGTSPSIVYTYQYSAGAVDNNKVEIINNQLSIKGELQGDVTIVASAAAAGDYHESKSDDPSTPAVNEDEKAYLVLGVSSKAKVKFTPSYVGNIGATSDEAKGVVGLGEISIDPTTETGYTLAIGTVQLLDKAASTPGNEVYIPYAGKSGFIIKKDVNSGKQYLYVDDTKTSLPPGKYIVEVTGKKGTDEATAKEITIVVEEAEMDVTKIKWVQKDKATDSYSPVSGQIDKVTKTNTGTHEKIYSNVNGVNETFYVNVENKNDTLLDGATITYSLSTDSVSGVISVASNGQVTIHKASQTNPLDNVFVLATISKAGFKDLEVKLPIEIKKGTSDFQFTKKDGTQYPLVDSTGTDTTKYKPLNVIYATGTDALIDVFTQSAPAGTDVTFEIKYNGTSSALDKNDVLKFADAGLSANADTDNPKTCVIKDADYSANRLTQCQAMIENALKDQAADKNMVVLYASIQATDNYNAMKIEIPINVSQAENSDWDFKNKDIYVQSDTDGSFEPIFITQDSTHPNIGGSGKITLLLMKKGEQAETLNINFDLLEYNKNDPDYTNGYRTFKYNIIVPELGPNDEEVYHVYAQKEKDRNWKASGEKELTVHILREGTSQFQITVLPYPIAGGPPAQSITYGDEFFKIEAYSPDDDTDTAATYKYTIDSTATDYLSSYTGNGGADEFVPIKAGTSIKLNIERTAGNGTTMNGSTWITIAKRPIKLKIDDITKKSGMLVDVADYQFTSTSESFLAQDIAKIKTTFQCEDANGDDVSSFIDGIRMEHNQLPIRAIVEPLDPTDKVLDNYEIFHADGTTSGIEQGKLIVSEDESLSTWYNVKPGKIDPTTDTVLGMNDWYNGPVDVEILSIAGSYDQISFDDKLGPWSTTSVTTSDEGDKKHNIYFRKSSAPEEGAITKAIEETIKIDTVAPEIVNIKATLTHTDAFSKIINTITFGMFMKPGEEVTISTKDVQANPAVAVSTTNSITDGITYNVYTIDVNGNRDQQVVTNGLLDTDSTGTGVFTLADPGVYEVCAIVKDQATNESLETCEKLLVKKIHIDVDGDGENDYLDPGNDGCPDIDIVLKDDKGDFYKLNVDRDKDNIPDMNIDSNADGIADINVDTDKDGKPDLNLVILSTWEPTFCVTDQSDEYCTMKGIEPVINVDTGTDGIPDINIDTNGDFKPDFNVTRPGETKPYLNIGKVHEKWEPNKNDCVQDKFTFDTAMDGKPLVNYDSDKDGRPDINVDTNNDGKPDINIDIEGDGIPDLDIDGDGDGIPDFNLDADENGKPTKNVIIITEWIPEKDGSINGVDFDTMGGLTANDTLVDDDSGIQIQKPGGSFLPNYSIKVDNIKDSVADKDKEKINEHVKDNLEIKDVYDVKLSDGTSIIQPDGSVKVRIPLRNDLQNTDSLKVIVEQKDGTYKEISATIKDGFIEYETDFLGKVGILADKEASDSDVTIPDLKPNLGGSTPDTSVKGNYTSGLGGAGTGDSTSTFVLGMTIAISIFTLLFLTSKMRKQDDK